MEEAKGGAGSVFMRGKVNDPRYKHTHDKIRHNHDHADGTKTEVHYWRERETGEETGHKFKDAPDNQASRLEAQKDGEE